MQNTIVQSAKPILAYSRISGEPLALVPSASEPNVYHITTASSCSCKSFTYRSLCKHLPAAAAVKPALSLVSRWQA